MHRVRAEYVGPVGPVGLVRRLALGCVRPGDSGISGAQGLPRHSAAKTGAEGGTVGWQSTPFLLAFPEKTDELKGFQGIKPAVERQFPGPGVVRRIPENIVPAPEKSSFFQKLYCTGTQIFF